MIIINGYIKLFRQIKSWKWYKNVNTFKAFIHCILEANYCDKEHEGMTIKRGSFLTGRKEFGLGCGLSEQSVRTAWTNLKSTNEITISATNKGSLITVVNYEKYQPFVEFVTNTSTSETPNEQPASNQQVTTTKNIKNINNTNMCVSCHLGSKFKTESCVSCMKKYVCQNPTSSHFKFLYNKTFEEWDKERDLKIASLLENQSNDNNCDVFDYNYFEDHEDNY